MEPDEALADLRKLPGIGPMYAMLILLRATGVTDVLTFAEPRLADYMGHFYGPHYVDAPTAASREEIERVAAGWRPYRTWAAVLVRHGRRARGPAARRVIRDTPLREPGRWSAARSPTLA